MLRWIAALLAMVVLIGSYLTFTQRNNMIAARAELQAVQTRAKAELRINDMVREYAAQQEARADSAEAYARRAVVVAEAAEDVLAAAPTTRDSLHAAILAMDAYRQAYHGQLAASAALRLRGDSALAANERLAGVVRDYGNASTHILKATKPSFLQRIIPTPGLSVTAGISPITRRADVIVGPSLSWTF